MDLRCCDNMELMAEFEDNHFDLAIVDPPYGMKISSGGPKNYGIDLRKGLKKWDIAPDDSYFKELLRVSKNQIIWGANYFPFIWSSPCRGILFWNKDPSVENYSSGELAWTSFDTVAKYFYYAWNGLADGIKGRVKKNKSIHPTQKPTELYKWLLENYASKGDKILDTHGGSMSIAIACHYLGFDLTLCELDKDYFDAGMKRIEQETAQISLF